MSRSSDVVSSTATAPSYAGEDLAGHDFTGADLRGANFSRANLAGSRFVAADVSNAVFCEADLTGAEFLGAFAEGADFSSATLVEAGFGKLEAANATFFGVEATAASFGGADLTGADMRAGVLTEARFSDSTLDGASFERARMHGCDLSHSSVAGTSFHNADLSSSRLKLLQNFKSADWIGADLRDIDFSGSWLLRRHALDENYLHDFRSQSTYHEYLYRLWWLTSDCGRSLLRLALWTVGIALVYAAIYPLVGIDWGSNETGLSPLYYSVVTFTTLGYGDVLPTTTAGQLVAMSEVVFGYLSLGALLSLFSSKLARRAG